MEETKIKENTITDLLNEFNIELSKDYNLILWNDHVNDMMYVVSVICELCEIDYMVAINFMMEAHKNGKTIVKSGSEEDMKLLKDKFNSKNLEATVELA